MLLIINYCYPLSSCFGNDVETKEEMMPPRFFLTDKIDDRRGNFWHEFMSGWELQKIGITSKKPQALPMESKVCHR